MILSVLSMILSMVFSTLAMRYLCCLSLVYSFNHVKVAASVHITTTEKANHD